MATSIIGQPVNRIDGRKKVTGRADYAVDRSLDRLAYGYGVPSTIAKGRIVSIDTSAAEGAEGFVAAFHPGKFPPVYRSANEFEGSSKVGEARPPFADDQIYYAGQFVALVVAETFEQARAAARLVKVVYEEQKPLVDWTDDPKIRPDGDQSNRGEPLPAFGQSEVRQDATYWTPVETHNPMEMHGAVAHWNGDRLTVHSSTQGVIFERNALAQVLGIAPDRIEVLSPYIGSGFGGKLFMWPHTVLAAVAARELRRPVKLSVTRSLMFSTVGHRPGTRQRVRLGATQDGKLTAIQHDSVSQTSYVDTFLESCAETTKALYSCKNVGVTHGVTEVNRGTPTPMRAPGAAPGLFALESAMDELAAQLKMDPVELRLKNIAQTDEANNRPWSGNHLHECLQSGAQKFGWAQRTAEPGSMREGEQIRGLGVAACSWPAPRGKCSARVEIKADGTARASCATQDIGTGTYTVIAQVVSQLTGLPLDKVEVKLGDTALPPGPLSGGSQVTATVMPAVAAATREALARLRRAAAEHGGPFAGKDHRNLEAQDGSLIDKSTGQKATFAEILRSKQLAGLDGEGTTQPGPEAGEYSFRSFGAHFVEVRWDKGISRLQVVRTVSVLDAGRIVNEKTARNQVAGAVVMGVGMALFEETICDSRSGRLVNDNFADYLVPVHTDCPIMDVVFLDYPDFHLNEFGVRGLGEIGLTGLAAAVANAVYHATGKRVRDLPILMEKLMA